MKFRRRVAWGSEDTIIRFSIVGDTNGIRSILQSGTGSLNDIDPNHGRTALHVSAFLHHFTEKLHLLTEFKYAVMKNQVPACRFLLDAGADRFVEDEGGTLVTPSSFRV
jgi:hypothetical protein